MSNGDHTPPPRVPSREQGTGMVRHAPAEQFSREKHLFLLPHIVTTLAVVILVVLVGSWIWPSHSNDPSLQRTARTYDTNAPTAGYGGQAINTHLLSPDWASGIETAWRIPLTPGDEPRRLPPRRRKHALCHL